MPPRKKLKDKLATRRNLKENKRQRATDEFSSALGYEAPHPGSTALSRRPKILSSYWKQRGYRPSKNVSRFPSVPETEKVATGPILGPIKKIVKMRKRAAKKVSKARKVVSKAGKKVRAAKRKAGFPVKL